MGSGGWWAGCGILAWVGLSEESKRVGSKTTVKSGREWSHQRVGVVKKRDLSRDKAGLEEG